MLALSPIDQTLRASAVLPSVSPTACKRLSALLLRAMGALGSALLLYAPAQAQTIHLAHDQAFPPFAEFSQGVSKGISIDVVKEAAKRAGLEIVFMPIAMQDQQKVFAEGKVDGVFPLAINAQRRETMGFTTPLLMTGGALFVRAPAATPKDWNELAGKKVVTPKTGPLSGYIAKNAPQVQLVDSKNYEESLSQLVNGEVDAAALNFQVGKNLAAQLHPGKVTPPNTLFLELPLAIAFIKTATEPAWVARINSALAAMAVDGSLKRLQN